MGRHNLRPGLQYLCRRYQSPPPQYPYYSLNEITISYLFLAITLRCPPVLVIKLEEMTRRDLFVPGILSGKSYS